MPSPDQARLTPGSEAVRSLFEGLRDKAFLDAACVSLLPRPAADAVREFLADCELSPEESSSAHHVAMDARRRVAAEEGARLLKTTPDHIALVESTTHGLNIAATSLPLPAGSTVVITDLEFLQVPIPWAVRGDLKIVMVENRGGRFDPADFEAALRPRAPARIVVVSSVQWCNGYRMDLSALSEICRRYEAFLVVDAVQHLGVLSLDAPASGADVVVAGGHKWLNAPLGCGLMYVSDRFLEVARPVFWGYLNLEEPEGGWPAYFATPTISPLRRWTFVREARRFEIGGTSNYPGAIALGASLRLVNEVTIEAAERHALELGDYLAERLAEVGAAVITPLERAARSAIVTFRFYRDLADEKALLDELHRERVYVAMRFTSGVGGIRVSCHYFNNRQDVDRLVHVLRKAASRRSPDYARS